MEFTPPVVIFVRPQAQGNIGALCRVMANFDCLELRLVSPEKNEDFYSAMNWSMATKKGQHILERAQIFKSLEEALADCHYSVGTSGREIEFEKFYARPFQSPEDVFNKIKVQLLKTQEPKWALVFGPEDDGLMSEESALCDWLIKVPTSPECPSMNIAMCAGVLLYHWKWLTYSKSAPPHETSEESPQLDSYYEKRQSLAKHGQKEKFISYLMQTLEKTDFFKYPDQEQVRARIRNWLQEYPIPVGELLFAFEIVYQLRCWGQGHHENRNFLS